MSFGSKVSIEKIVLFRDDASDFGLSGLGVGGLRAFQQVVFLYER